jgi:hypothetical protein
VRLAALTGQGPGKAEGGQDAVVEAGHRTDSVTCQGENHKPGRMQHTAGRIPEVATVRGLAIGPGRLKGPKTR